MKNKGIAPAITLLISAIGIAIAVYAGFYRWPLWVIPVLAVPLALNRANARAMSKSNSLTEVMSAFVVSLPVLAIFAAFAYGMGFLFVWILNKFI